METNHGGASVETQKLYDEAGDSLFVEVDLFEWLNHQADAIEEEDRVQDLELKRLWDRRRFHYVDEGYGQFIGGRWVSLGTVEATHGDKFESPVCEQNYYAYFLRQAMWQISGAMGSFRCQFPTDQNADLEAGHVANLLGKQVLDRNWGPVTRQNAALNNLLCGTWILGLKWNPDLGCKMQRAIYEEREIDFPSVYECKECETSAEEEAECPECGKPMTLWKEGAKEKHHVKVGAKEERCGLPEWEVPDPKEFKGDFAARCVKSTMYWRRLREVSTGFITSSYEKAIARSGAYRNQQLAIMTREMDVVGSDAVLLSLMSNPIVTKKVEFGQYYLHPAAYDRVKLRKPAQLMNGIVLEKGSRLKDYFPKGMLFVLTGREVLDLAPAVKEEEWFLGHCHRVSNRLWGHTFAESLRKMQQNLDRLLTIAIQSAWYNAAPTTLIDSTYIDKSDVSGDVDNIVDIRGAAADGKPLTNFFARVEGRGVDNQVPNLSQLLIESERQVSAGFTPNGSGGANPSTAEAARIMQATAASSLTPTLDEMNEVVIAALKRSLKMIQEEWDSDDAYIGLCGNITPEQIDAFKRADLERLVITVDPTSRMPQTQYDRIQNLMAFAQQFLGQARQFYTPRELEMFAREIGVHLDSFLDKEDRREARDRIETLKSAARRLAQDRLIDKPEALLALIAVIQPIPNVDLHMVISEEYKAYLKSAEGKLLPEAARQALIQACALHKQMQLTEAIAEQQAMAAAQAMAQPQPPVEQPPPEPADSSPVSPQEEEALQQMPAEEEVPAEEAPPPTNALQAGPLDGAATEKPPEM